jgi:hypothetical protein
MARPFSPSIRAADLIRKLARPDNASSDPTAPATVAGSINDYRKDLRARGGDEGNANRLLKYLSAALLSRPVALLTTKELRVVCSTGDYRRVR